MPDSKQFQKIVNRSHVLQKMRESHGISRIEISRQLGLDRSTITNLVNPLLEMGLVKEISRGDSPVKGGRRPVLLGLDEEYGSILGIELQISSYEAVLTNINGEVLKEWDGPLAYQGLSQTIEKIYKTLQGEIDEFSMPLKGIGIGLPAIVDPVSGVVLKATAFGIENLDLLNELSKTITVPILIDNDANCCAWGQLERNKKNKLENFLNLIWKLHRREGEEAPEEIEIGMGVVLGGDVYYGDHFSAGELPEDLISREAANIYQSGAIPGQINPQALEGYLDKLFQYLLPIFHVFDPGEVFFGGQFCRFEDQVRQRMAKTNFQARFSGFDHKDTAYGAASMFVEKLFQTPNPQGLDLLALLESDL